MPSQKVLRASYQVRGLGFRGIAMQVLKMAFLLIFECPIAHLFQLQW
jgi:hypothetical protein